MCAPKKIDSPFQESGTQETWTDPDIHYAFYQRDLDCLYSIGVLSRFKSVVSTHCRHYIEATPRAIHGSKASSTHSGPTAR